MEEELRPLSLGLQPVAPASRSLPRCRSRPHRAPGVAAGWSA